ncbi:rab11 family-interacting protein 4A-like [Centropristis striata]|uniref:rab11 family-interacting protein 4A-like n=1 Tax=Centropristis striata TaxID=184440 RepID=UPI0027DF9635|nr:rab11 family-interacting protein 4A-like [Centropristis striata]
MDEDFVPEPERLLAVVRKLKEVFDVCDEDSDGFICPEHFVQLGSQFGQAEQVKKLAKCLDRDSHGRINFKDFCRGVLTMKGYVGILKKKSGARFITGPYETVKSFCRAQLITETETICISRFWRKNPYDHIRKDGICNAAVWKMCSIFHPLIAVPQKSPKYP